MKSKTAKLVIKEFKSAKLITWTKSVLSRFKLHKGSRAGIIVDKGGVPQLFIFDTPAFLDVLSAIDEALIDKVSDEEYNSKTTNPAGWLIDEIEAKLPPNPKFVQSLKDAVAEAKRKGWIPFAQVLQSIGVNK